MRQNCFICPSLAFNAIKLNKHKKTTALMGSMAASASIFLTVGWQSAFAQGTTGSELYRQGMQLKVSGGKNARDQALVKFIDAVRQNPRDCNSLYQQALLFREKGYSKLAVSALDRILSIKPDDREARLLLAAIKLEAGDHQAAAQQLSSSLGLLQPAPKTHGAIKEKIQRADTTQCVAPRGITFTPDSSAETKTTASQMGITSVLPVSASLPNLDQDEWAQRMRYLAIHGTGTLQAGQAFMFSEDSGEAVIILNNGERIRRRITKPRDAQTLVKQRRPDVLTADLTYNLSTLGKLVGNDPQKALDMATEAELEKITKEYGDYHDNGFLEQAYLTETELDRNSAQAVDARLEKAPGEVAKIQNEEIQGEKRIERDVLKEFENELPAEGFVERSQKFFNWVKKSLKLP